MGAKIAKMIDLQD